MRKIKHLTTFFFLFVISLTACATASEKPSDLNPVTIKTAISHTPIVLVRKGKPVAQISVISKNPSRQLNAAVAELVSCIKAISGATMTVVQGPVQGPAIVIGNPQKTSTRWPVEGFTIKSDEQHIYIAGNDDIIDAASNTRSFGSTWGVYEFCERFLNVRWYYPTNRGGRSILKQSTITINPMWITDAPIFRHRTIWPSVANSYSGTGQRLGPLHAALRSNNSWPIRLKVHFPHWQNDDDYKKNRPEIFQLKSNGQRQFTMLCYGHPKTLETYFERIDLEKRGIRKADFIIGNAITVSPDDLEISCTDQYCKKLWDAKGGQYGTASVIMANFVNKLAIEVKKRWPNMTIIYLPYLNYTKAPNGFKFPNNVQVQICGMPGLAQYKEPKINQSEQANIDAWVKTTGQKIQNWHYSCWPEDKTTAPYLFPHVIKKHYLKNKNKTVGTFINGLKNHWPRQHLSLYCWMKVLWNPDFDVDAAIDKYCIRMFGPASKTMRQLVQIQIDGWEKSRWPGGRLSSKGIFNASYPRQKVVLMATLLKQARAQAASNAQVLKHIDYYATPFKNFFEESKNVAEGTGLTPLLIQKVGTNPKIDGRLDEPIWQRLNPNHFVRATDRKQKKCTYPTTVRAVWSPTGVTFSFHMDEPTPKRLEVGNDGRDNPSVWWNDCVEIFLDPTGKSEGDFYQFIFDSKKGLYDAHGKDLSWNTKGLKWASFIGADFWSLEVFIPYQTFPNTHAPRSGDHTQWTGNLMRHRVADNGKTWTKILKKKPALGSSREYQRMNTTYSPSSANLSDFAPLRFVE